VDIAFSVLPYILGDRVRSIFHANCVTRGGAMVESGFMRPSELNHQLSCVGDCQWYEALNRIGGYFCDERVRKLLVCLATYSGGRNHVKIVIANAGSLEHLRSFEMYGKFLSYTHSTVHLQICGLRSDISTYKYGNLTIECTEAPASHMGRDCDVYIGDFTSGPQNGIVLSAPFWSITDSGPSSVPFFHRSLGRKFSQPFLLEGNLHTHCRCHFCLFGAMIAQRDPSDFFCFFRVCRILFADGMGHLLQHPTSYSSSIVKYDAHLRAYADLTLRRNPKQNPNFDRSRFYTVEHNDSQLRSQWNYFDSIPEYDGRRVVTVQNVSVPTPSVTIESILCYDILYRPRAEDGELPDGCDTPIDLDTDYVEPNYDAPVDDSHCCSSNVLPSIPCPADKEVIGAVAVVHNSVPPPTATPSVSRPAEKEVFGAVTEALNPVRPPTVIFHVPSDVISEIAPRIVALDSNGEIGPRYSIRYPGCSLTEYSLHCPFTKMPIANPPITKTPFRAVLNDPSQQYPIDHPTWCCTGVLGILRDECAALTFLLNLDVTPARKIRVCNCVHCGVRKKS